MAAVLEPVPTDRARAELAVLGYTGAFTVGADGLVCCDVCGVSHEPADVRTPDTCLVDGTVVLAAVCPCCNRRGVALGVLLRPRWVDLTASEGGVAFG
jgi:hypothetical protein